MTDVDQALSLERAAQALADAIGGGGRTAWALAVESPTEGLRLYSSEPPDRARALLKRASERS